MLGTPALTCHGRSQGLVQDNADVRPEAAIPGVRSLPMFFSLCGARFEACDLWFTAGRRPVSRACVVFCLLTFQDCFVFVRCGCSNYPVARSRFFPLLCDIGPCCFVACCAHVLFPSPLSTGLTCRPKLRSPLSSRLQLNSSRYLPPRRPSLRGMGVASIQDSRRVRDLAGCPLCSLFWVGMYFARIALALAIFPPTGGRTWRRGPVCRLHANRRPPDCIWCGFPLPPHAGVLTSIVIVVWPGPGLRRRFSEARRGPSPHPSRPRGRRPRLGGGLACAYHRRLRTLERALRAARCTLPWTPDARGIHEGVVPLVWRIWPPDAAGVWSVAGAGPW